MNKWCKELVGTGAAVEGSGDPLKVFLYGRHREVLAVETVVMHRRLKCPVRVVWVFRQTRFVAFFSTDLRLSPEQIIEYYGARWKIESGFKSANLSW